MDYLFKGEYITDLAAMLYSNCKTAICRLSLTCSNYSHTYRIKKHQTDTQFTPNGRILHDGVQVVS